MEREWERWRESGRDGERKKEERNRNREREIEREVSIMFLLKAVRLPTAIELGTVEL